MIKSGLPGGARTPLWPPIDGPERGGLARPFRWQSRGSRVRPWDRQKWTI